MSEQQYQKGDRVRVTTAERTGLPVQTLATVYWVGPDKYRKGLQRLGLDDGKRKAFMSAASVELAHRPVPAQVRPSDAVVRRVADDIARGLRGQGGSVSIIGLAAGGTRVSCAVVLRDEQAADRWDQVPADICSLFPGVPYSRELKGRVLKLRWDVTPEAAAACA